MLRFFVLILILANGLYLAWSQGWLRAHGFAPAQQSEPQRLAQQIRPEAIQILTPAEEEKLKALMKADLEPRQCLRAGPFETAQVSALDQVLGTVLPPGGWQFESVVVPEHWIIYMGKFANNEARDKKLAELSVLKLAPIALQNPSLEIGLSLAGFDTEAEASAALAKLTLRGIRTARVVQERASASATYLRLPDITEALRLRLVDIKPPLLGYPLKPCA